MRRSAVVGYTLNQWPKLVRCLECAEVVLSNNLVVNSMRGVVLGRKNWLHVGSVKAGPKVAAILSMVESCRRIGALARFSPQGLSSNCLRGLRG